MTSVAAVQLNQDNAEKLQLSCPFCNMRRQSDPVHLGHHDAQLQLAVAVFLLASRTRTLLSNVASCETASLERNDTHLLIHHPLRGPVPRCTDAAAI